MSEFISLPESGGTAETLKLRHITDRDELDSLDVPSDVHSIVEITVQDRSIMLPRSAFLGLLQRLDIL